MKVQLIGLLLFYLVTSKNIPLQLEIGLIQFEDLQPGKLKYQEIQFDQPFIRVPQVALTINSLMNHNSQVYFSKIYNVTTDGFTIGVLSGTEQSLEYRYMAIVDDRVQVNCLNFKVKEIVFIPYLKQFVKVPKSWVFLTGVRQQSNTFSFQQDIRNEGIMLKFQSIDTEILGVCVVAGAVDILQSRIDDLPTFQGYNLMKQQIALSIIAQSSFNCEDECLLYFRNDQTKQLKINTEFHNQQEKPSISKFIPLRKENPTISQDKVENLIEQTIKIDKIEQPHISHEDSLKKMINQSILNLEEQINHPNGINSFDSNLNEISQQEDIQSVIESDSDSDSDSESEDEEDEEDEITTIKISKPINIEEELQKLEKISEDRTKKINIIEFNPKESINVSFLSRNNIDMQEESKAEKLIELKYIDRAPKFSPKIQQMFEEAKKNIEVEQSTIDKVESKINNKLLIKDQLKLKTESLMQQIENTSHTDQKDIPQQLTINNKIEQQTQDIPNQPIEEEQKVTPPTNEKQNTKKPILNEYETIFAQFANNNNLRSVKQQQRFSSPLFDTEITIELDQEEQQTEPQQELKVLNPREERLQKYLQKADEVDLNFLENIKLVSEQNEQQENSTVEQDQIQEVFDQSNVSYTEQLNLRKNQILQELQQKYNIKASPIQSFEEFKLKVPQDQYPQILYEKYLEQLKKQHIGASFIETDHNVRSIENSYQLEAAYYEWHLQKNI
ncbi:unnamed protein product [Paramecium pentaurelia]|uniref:H-type lectin domain-containing protein n=1 Tax=Paramecium pentaurelia TaxID=43138 RepID=A0A8S1TPT8_9CILI|nr:unnamed protein product [Paramecium pentaurelia]